MDRNAVLQKISGKEKVGGIIWIVVASIQLMIGLAVNWVIMIIGIWNFIIGIMRIVNAGKMDERADTIVEQYEKDLVNIIIFLIVNIFIGGLIGVAGAIFDLVTRNYVMNNKNIIMGTASESGDKYEKLAKLQELKNRGTISEMEFEIEKSKILR